MSFPKYCAAGIITGADWDAFVLAMVAHAVRHELGGVDEIDVTSLSGLLADDQHVLDAEVLAVAAALVHAAQHMDGGADELDVSELAGALGGAGEVPETDGAAVTWVDPDGRYDPAAHVLATTGPHTNELPLTDLAAGVQGNVIIRGAADWEALAVGTVGQVLLTGGAGASPAWGNSPGLPVFIAAPNPDGNTGTHAGMNLPDGVSTLARMDFILPYNFDVTTWGVDVLIIPEGTGDLRRGVATNFGLICANEGKATNTDSIALGQVAVTQDEIECISITAALTGSTALDLVGMEFTRDAVLGNGDTVGAACYFVGVVIRPP